MPKIEKNQFNFILINLIVFTGIIIISLMAYIWYKMFFPTKIVKDLPKNIDWFVEFQLWYLENLEEILWEDIPWFSSYSDKIFDIKKWAIINYKWEKIDILLTWSKRKSIKILDKINWNSSTKSWSLILSLESPIPPCVQKWASLFCGKNTKILKELLAEKTQIRENKKFLKIENNLYKKYVAFFFIDIKNSKKLNFTKWKFDSIWATFKKNNWKIEWIIFWNYNEKYKNLDFEEKRKLKLEKYVNIENTVAIFWARDFEKQALKIFKKSEENQSYLPLLWKWLIQWKLKEVFWENISLEEFLKIFWKEAIFSIFKENWKYEFEIIAEKTDFNKKLLKKYEENLKRFLPFKEVFKYKDVVLEQISVNKKNIKKTEELLTSAKIYWFKAEEQDFWIYFSEWKKIIRISSSLKRIKKSFKLSLKDLWKYLPKMPYSNDFWYLNSNNFKSFLEEFNMWESVKIPKFLKNKQVSWANITFKDWMQIKLNIENEAKFVKKIEKKNNNILTNSGSIILNWSGSKIENWTGKILKEKIIKQNDK